MNLLRKLLFTLPTNQADTEYKRYRLFLISSVSLLRKKSLSPIKRKFRKTISNLAENTSLLTPYFLRRGVFNTRPRDFYDVYILTTTQEYDKALFADALKATAEHRGTSNQISDVPDILKNLEESSELKSRWDKYRKQFAYATDISYEQIVEVLSKLFL